MAPRTERTARQRQARGTPSNPLPPPQLVWTPVNDPASVGNTSTTTGIDVETVTRTAKEAIEARQQTIQQLRLLGDELRAALQHVESLHEALTSGYNPPMSNTVGVVSSGSIGQRLNR